MHAGTLSDAAQRALGRLGTSGILTTAYLAGGSALALHLGHRKSYDFDFYTREHLRAEDIAVQLQKVGSFATTLLEPPHTILGIFDGVKFSLFRYDYPLIGPTVQFSDVTIASVDDIAAMKLSAICGRATKRDYVDLYMLAHRFSWEELLGFYEKKFANLSNNLYFILKAISYQEDAESDIMPQMIAPLSWEECKTFFATESIRLGRKYLEGK